VQRVADALVEGGPYDANPRHLRSWADALGTEIGEADLQGAGAMLDRVYRALETPTARRGPHVSVAVSSRHVGEAGKPLTARECGQQAFRGVASLTLHALRSARRSFDLSMRAVVVTRSGGPEVLELREQRALEPGRGELVVDVEAAGVNYRDIYEREGRGAPPLIAGVEGAGKVASVGENVTEFAVGDRVAWIDAQGSYAQQVVVPAARAVPVPADVSSELAAAALLQGMTAHYLATTTYRVMPGDDVLAHAVGGGVGLLLTQVVKMRGGRVIGTTSSEEKERRARAAGADDVIPYEGFGERARELTGGDGVAVAYDGVGQATFDESLRALRTRGHMVLFGAASGRVPPFDPMRLEDGGSLFLTRPSLRHYVAKREELLERAAEVFRWIGESKLDVHIGGRYPLADARRAHEDLAARRTSGKLLLVPD
jgi:NADPH:quinone reductase